MTHVSVNFLKNPKIAKKHRKSSLKKERSWGTKFGNLAIFLPINTGPLNTLKGEQFWKKRKKNRINHKPNPNPKTLSLPSLPPLSSRLSLFFSPQAAAHHLPVPPFTASHLTKPVTSPLHLTRATHFPPLQPTLPISSPLPAGLLFFFTHRSQPPLHTPDKLPFVSHSSAHRAVPIISSAPSTPSAAAPPRAPPSSPQPTDLSSSTGYRPRSPSSA